MDNNLCFIKYFFSLLLLFSLALNADTPSDIAKKAHISNINALLIFTSQEGLNSGHYKFSKVGVEMEVYHLPFIYHLNKGRNINYFIVGNVGYSRTFISDDVVIPPNSVLNYHNHLRTYTAGLNGGVRYTINKEINILSGVELIYSRSGASVKKSDNDYGDAIEDFFNKNYNDNLSYKLFASLEYRPMHYKFKPYVSLDAKFYETRSGFVFDSEDSYISNSSIVALQTGIETPSLYESSGNHLTLEAYVNVDYLSGGVVKSVKFDKYVKLGSVAYWNTPHSISWAERFFVEISRVYAYGLEGYNVGVGFTVDF